ncbi:MAG: hypothetical protein ACJASB_000203 [Shewanella psychromarinicola]|jgi:hypothetical protein|uniref:cytoplasmic protein n=1 Tax=Shewanella psychromarinicola TaxID=2487742 RepID=UPI003EEFAB4F
MSLNDNSPSSMPITIDSGNSLKVAVMAKDQQKIEAQMALQLIAAAQLSAQRPAPQQ